jgi:hypothetical protein
MSPVPEQEQEIEAPITQSQVLSALITQAKTFDAPLVLQGENANVNTGGSGKGDPVEPDFG